VSEPSEPKEPPPPPEAEAEPALAAEPIADPDAALRDAVGARANPPPRPETPLPDVYDSDGEVPGPTKSRRRTILIASGSIFVGLLAAALIFLGRANAERYLITCATDRVAAEQGRSFPPWGSHAMSGDEWKPISLPPNAECKPRETEDEAELGGWYLDALVDRASVTLGAHDLLDTMAAAPAGSANPLDTAEQQLRQALLLARSPERRDQRKEIERLLGDVAYWRAALRLRDATAALADAAKQYDAAATQRPRHATDAAAWGTFLRRVGDELHGGPAGGPAPAQPEPVPSRPIAPPGTALPVEPPAGSAAEPPPAPAPADAGVPTGGVLL
jgi:hypothetical protein